MRALITGITGFVGSYLAEFLLESGRPEGDGASIQVFGTVRWRSRTENIDHLRDRVQLVECDLKDLSSVRNTLSEVQPDYIFHLAAQSFVVTSWHAPADTLANNILSQLNLFEAARQLRIEPRIQIAGSSEEYGLTYPHELPIKETNPLRPLSPYAVSKVTQDLMGFQYFRSYGLPIIRTRAFNHSGPRRGDVFVESNFAKQVAEIEKGLRPPVIKVGNLEAKRDYTDVRDIVRGYWLALEKGDPGSVYNLCSGKALAISEVLDVYLQESGIKVTVEQDSSRMRPSDVPVLVGDSTLFREKTGWTPKIPFRDTLKEILNYWRARVPTKV
ncbi:MAG: GDP-mannose 4,6-dehydratase [Armatimonadetes bacterium]|nr:GDP-mannose 4,6-dehydratase [Armatimonadota bacterium]